MLIYFNSWIKSPVTSKIFYDRVAQFADLDTLSGLITNNTNTAITTSSGHFLQAWQELYDASYNQNNLIKPEWLDALILQKRNFDSGSITISNHKFHVSDLSKIAAFGF